MMYRLVEDLWLGIVGGVYDLRDLIFLGVLGNGVV